MVVKVRVIRYNGLVQHKETGAITKVSGLYTGKKLKTDFFNEWKQRGDYRPLIVDRDGYGLLSFEAPLFVGEEEVNVNE